jgi:hypothetical protein
VEGKLERFVVKNLDVFAAETAQAIIGDTASSDAGKVDNLVTKALGVLQENGVYAGLLYLYSRTEGQDKVIAKKTRERLLSLLPKLELRAVTGMEASVALEFLIEEVCNDLDTLLLVKQVWEQTLIYTRYGAKARSVEEARS